MFLRFNVSGRVLTSRTFTSWLFSFSKCFPCITTFHYGGSLRFLGLAFSGLRALTFGRGMPSNWGGPTALHRVVSIRILGFWWSADDNPVFLWLLPNLSPLCGGRLRGLLQWKWNRIAGKHRYLGCELSIRHQEGPDLRLCELHPAPFSACGVIESVITPSPREPSHIQCTWQQQRGED